MPKYKSKAL